MRWLATVLLGAIALVPGSEARDHEMFACEGSARSWRSPCRILDGSRGSSPTGPPSTGSEPPEIRAPTTDDLLRGFLEAELADREREERRRRAGVRSPEAPESFVALMESPSRESAVGFLSELGRQNVRLQRGLREVRSLVDELDAGTAGPDLASFDEARSTVDRLRIRPRGPVDAYRAIRRRRMERRLRQATGEPGAVAPPASDVGSIVVLHFFSESCPHCRRMSPEVEELHRRYGRALEVIGVPVDLVRGTADRAALEAYRRRAGISFPFELRPREVARLARAHGVDGWPHTILTFPELPDGPIEVGLRGYQPLGALEELLASALTALAREDPTTGDPA